MVLIGGHKLKRDFLMKHFTVALSLVVILALSACAQGTTSCSNRTAGDNCVKTTHNADTMFNKSLRK